MCMQKISKEHLFSGKVNTTSSPIDILLLATMKQIINTFHEKFKKTELKQLHQFSEVRRPGSAMDVFNSTQPQNDFGKNNYSTILFELNTYSKQDSDKWIPLPY